jgi:hypothetical protein
MNEKSIRFSPRALSCIRAISDHVDPAAPVLTRIILLYKNSHPPPTVLAHRLLGHSSIQRDEERLRSSAVIMMTMANDAY